MSWLQGEPALDRDVSVDEYHQAFGPAVDRLDAAVLVEAAADDDALDDELEWIERHLDGTGPVRAAVAGWRPRSDPPLVRRRLDALNGVPGVVGLRHVLHPPDRTAADLLDDRHVQAVRLAGERGLLVELCVRPDQLEAAARLIDLAPGTRIVLDHLGRPRTAAPLDESWSEAMAAIAARPGVSTKMSALIECAEGSPWSVDRLRPFVQVALDRFGSDRVVWGSNWPVCFTTGTLADWVSASDRLLAGISPSERAAVLGGNARRIYAIS